MPNYKLIYFNTRGRAEPTRLCFAAGGIPYEDVRLTGEEWTKMKAENKTIMGYLPVLEVDGIQYCESMAIFRLAAKLAGLCPTCPYEQARCDMVVDCSSDLFAKAMKFFFEKDQEQKKKLQEEFKEQHLNKFWDIMERLLTAKCNLDGSAQYFVGNKLTYADIILFSTSDTFESMFPGMLENFPGLRDLFKRVGENPGIKAWIEKRPNM
ncbi:predicted protein [Nematostella vectensis]|uniref:glutathione transferase n=1 Tax=Nematostella vectensis TaxID=45351 RepID=A7RT47_NEMVE|nr:hematopoietic prostaglandin D synthase [Nematostella vectensis]EDO45327.1 predicted protein [Nematostella vectensis]|eukprot:XP_001637390.1 predicted protein [Nematostella vectensis]